MSKMIWSVAAVLGFLVGNSSASASPIVYTVSGTADGTLGANAFINSLVTVSFSGDTTNVTGVGFITNIPGTATVTIAGVGSATLTDAMAAFVNQGFSPPAAGIALAAGGSLFDTFNAGFASYDLKSPISLSGSSFINPGMVFHTTSGDFVLNTAGNSTFTASIGTAAVTPEPTTLIAFGVMALGGAGYVRRRKVAATA